MAKTNKPFISIIIVNFNGRYLLRDCLSAIYRTNYPENCFEVIVVDNNSADDSVSYITRYFPKIIVVALEENAGFAGGNIRGYEASKGEYIVLLNNDTIVEKNWLRTMVAAAKPARIGLVSPKLFYATPFLELTIESNVIPFSDINQSTDFSPVGVIIENIVGRSDEITNQIWYKSGFYEKIDGPITSRWTKGKASILVPFVSQQAEQYIFTFHGYPTLQKMNTPLSVSLANSKLMSYTIGSNEVKQFTVSISKKMAQHHLIWLVQNAGNIVMRDGYSKDRGSITRQILNGEHHEFYEEDNGFFNKPKKLLSMCGACCLIKRKVIEQVGFFDKHYFMYYEDVDLSLRAWRSGWDIMYEPKAIVYHRHKATTGQVNSSFFITMVEKNHLAFTMTHFPFTIFLVEFIRFMVRTAITISKATVFKFRDNLDRFRKWNTLAEGRAIAAISIIKHIPRLLATKAYWMKRQKRTYSDMKPFLY